MLTSKRLEAGGMAVRGRRKGSCVVGDANPFQEATSMWGAVSLIRVCTLANECRFWSDKYQTAFIVSETIFDPAEKSDIPFHVI